MFNSIPKRIEVATEQTCTCRLGSVDVTLPHFGYRFRAIAVNDDSLHLRVLAYLRDDRKRVVSRPTASGESSSPLSVGQWV
ncbi:hypothetical protein, partial [Sphingomonas pruni]|uniref:hypothetical protein n=1 Tax=Sphingomonas pruni TaxID=40683 RepID=UPI001FE21B2B